MSDFSKRRQSSKKEPVLFSDSVFSKNKEQEEPVREIIPTIQKEKEPKFRHELKYFINQGEAFLLEEKLHATMDRDPFAHRKHGYFIRSLYFDNYANRAVHDKIDGVEDRKKYRIRIYNLKDDNIRLECKEKKSNYISKRSIAIQRSTCEALMQGNPLPLLKYKHPLALEMYIAMTSELLRPVVLVDYTRQAFVHPLQDVRITIDKDLRTGFLCTDLFDPNVATISAKGSYDMILEVKFNQYLPSYFHQLIQMESLQKSAISKYIYCRQFE